MTNARHSRVRVKRDTASLGYGASGSHSLGNTVLAILAFVAIYRFGCFIPVPFIDALALHKMLQSYSFGMLNMFNTMSGGSLGRMAVFALGVVPYISASIILHIATHTYKGLQDIQAQGPSGAYKILLYTRIAAVIIALIQGWGMSAIALNISSDLNQIVTTDNVFLFQFLAMSTFATGSMVLIWMGDSITKLGFGSGISIIIFVSILSGVPSGVLYLFELSKSGALSPEMLLFVAIFIIALISLVIMFESGRRLVDLQYPGNKLSAAQGSSMTPNIPIKINVCGVMPAIFGSVFAGIPAMALSFTHNSSNIVVEYLSLIFASGSIGYSILLGCMIGWFGFYYIPIAFKANSIADSLKKRGAFIPGYRPGVSTANYLNSIVHKLMVFGVTYLIAVCTLPQLLLSGTVSGMYFSGTSVLIAVSVSLDLMQNAYSNIIMQRYDKMMK